MELLRLVAGWTRTVLEGGVHLRARGLSAQVTVRERVRPIPRLRELIGAAAGRALRFTTLEGEHAAQVTAGPRTVAVVVGDESATVVDGLATQASAAPLVERVVRELATHAFLGLGEIRRRRFLYAPPPGWTGLAAPHAARWLHPGYPAIADSITVRDARPRTAGAPELTDRLLLSDDSYGLVRDPPEPLVRVASRAGLSGVAARITGRFHDGGPQLTIVRATLGDERFSYVVELQAPGDAAERSAPALAALIDGIEPVPRPRAADLDGRVLWWGD